MVLTELKVQHLTQDEFAKRAGVTSRHLSRLFSGECAGSLGMWDKLLSTLGVKIWPDVSPPGAETATTSSRRCR